MLYKYHGCGNDFIMGFWHKNIDYSDLAKYVCNRYIGIGADGLILAKKNKDRFEMVFYNADGTRAPMCGNGIRCLAAFLNDNKYIKNNRIEIDTMSGVRTIDVINNEFVVNMGFPDFDKNRLDIVDEENNFKELINKKIFYKDKEFIVSAVYMTTHHLVCIVDDDKDDDLHLGITDDEGKFLCTNKLFSKGINVNFVKVIDKDNIKVRTYERGVGWTKACGSGSCASFVMLRKLNKVNKKVIVHLEYGKIEISENDNKEIVMKGPAIKICDIKEINK